MEVIKKTRTGEGVSKAAFIWETIAQVMSKIEAIINAMVEAIKSSSTSALAPNS